MLFSTIRAATCIYAQSRPAGVAAERLTITIDASVAQHGMAFKGGHDTR